MMRLQYWYERQEEELYYRELSKRHVVTRKPHNCALCKKELPIGSSATKLAFIGEDGFEAVYTHDGMFCPEDWHNGPIS